MRHALCIAYLFPPAGGGGVQRTVKFVKYLPEFNWQTTVMTAAGRAPLLDASLIADVPAATQVVRVRGLELPAQLPWRVRHWFTSWLLAVDPQIGWLPFALRCGHKLLRRQRVDLLYSTASPFTDHLVALRLKQRAGQPWVADFHDSWIGNFSRRFATPWHRRLCARLERTIVGAADRVLVVSEPMRQQFLHRYPDLPPDRFVTLPNGFDHSDYANAGPRSLSAQRLNLVYTGSLYGPQSARSLLAALCRALGNQQIDPQRFRLWLVGATGTEAAHLVEEWRLAHVVNLVAYVPHAELAGYQLGADALLLIIGRGPGSEMVLTGKIFEYLAVGKPIIALVPPGAAADLLAEAGAGAVVDPDDEVAIADLLVRTYNAWCAGRLQAHPDPNVVRRYERRRLTQRLASLFDALCESAA